MKKIVAIFFLSVLTFNWLGYRFVFDYLETRHTQQLQARLDVDNYNESDLVSIKAPISLPYYNNSTKFERVNGEIEINGIEYKYVKRRFFSDSVELLCIPNIAATQIKSAKEDFFRQTNDLQANDHGRKAPGETPVFKSLLSEYFEQPAEWNLAAINNKQLYNQYYLVVIPSYKADIPCQPPDIA